MAQQFHIVRNVLVIARMPEDPDTQNRGKSDKSKSRSSKQDVGETSSLSRQSPPTVALGGPDSDHPHEKDQAKWNPFFLSNPGHAIAIRIKELDQCCCANVPCISIVKEYCESSSLHGLRYITEDGRHWTERVLWVFLCTMGFVLTIYFIYPIWAKWNEKPTITTLDSTDHPVWEIDFPAVTVCPANKVIKSKFEEVYLKQGWKKDYGLDQNDLKRLIEMMVHFKSMNGVDMGKYQDLQQVVDLIGMAKLTNLMAEVMPNCNELILRCWWQGKIDDCATIFEVRKTNDGFCCTFNAIKLSESIDFSVVEDILAKHDLSEIGTHRLVGGLGEFMPEHMPEDEFQATDEPRPGILIEGTSQEPLQGLDQHEDISGNSSTNENEPQMSFGSPQSTIRKLNSANYRRGLTILLDSRSDEYFVTSDDFIGFKMLIHSPEAYPEVEGNTLAIGPGQEMFVSLTASHTDGSKAILDFPFEGRSCLFEDEKSFPQAEVTIFKDYSQENCQLECRAKLLLRKCGCLPYYYPRLDLVLKEREDFKFLKNSTCNWTGLNCLANSTEILDAIYPFSNDPNDSFPTAEPDQEDRLLKGGAVCNCPPACARTHYSAAQSMAKFPNKASQLIQEIQAEQAFSSSFKVEDLSLVHVYYKDMKVFKYHTDELFSWENILASFGGLIGLCTGFSFLSAAELAYFFSLRCMLPICRKKRKDKVAMINDSDLVVVKVED